MKRGCLTLQQLQASPIALLFPVERKDTIKRILTKRLVVNLPYAFLQDEVSP